MFSAFTIKSNFFPGYVRYYCTDSQLLGFFRKHLETQWPPSIRYCIHLAAQLLVPALISRCCATSFFFPFRLSRWSISLECIKQQEFNFHHPEKTALDASPSITHSSAPDLGNSIVFLPSGGSMDILWCTPLTRGLPSGMFPPPFWIFTCCDPHPFPPIAGVTHSDTLLNLVSNKNSSLLFFYFIFSFFFIYIYIYIYTHIIEA